MKPRAGIVLLSVFSLMAAFLYLRRDVVILEAKHPSKPITVQLVEVSDGAYLQRKMVLRFIQADNVHDSENEWLSRLSDSARSRLTLNWETESRVGLRLGLDGIVVLLD
jgi:hypothetical protein